MFLNELFGLEGSAAYLGQLLPWLLTLLVVLWPDFDSSRRF